MQKRLKTDEKRTKKAILRWKKWQKNDKKDLNKEGKRTKKTILRLKRWKKAKNKHFKTNKFKKGNFETKKDEKKILKKDTKRLNKNN